MLKQESRWQHLLENVLREVLSNTDICNCEFVIFTTLTSLQGTCPEPVPPCCVGTVLVAHVLLCSYEPRVEFDTGPAISRL